MADLISSIDSLITPNTHGDRSYPGFIGNFSKLITACRAIGIKYDPDNPMLAITHLVILLGIITSKNKAVIDLITPYKAALIARNVAYEMMSSYKTQILNALKSSENVKPAEVLIAINFGKKVDGIRIDPIKSIPLPTDTVSTVIETNEEEITNIEHHSVSYQKFAIKMNNFLIFFTYVTGLDCYTPKKTELQLAAIQAYYNTLAGLNSDADLATNMMSLARQERDIAFFHEMTGARHVGEQVKNYVSGDFTTKSEEFKLVKGIPFPDLRKKGNR